jgi:uncharacterized surface protein with fasciclin (FAS1) repeats
MLLRRTALAFVSATALALSACGTLPAAPTSIDQTLASTAELSTLSGLVQSAGLTDTLKGAGPFTVFAPSNEAFSRLTPKQLDDLRNNREQLRALLTFHVLPESVKAAAVKPGNAKTVNGANLPLSKAGDFVTVDDAMVTKADIDATNGVVHVVDRVLTPPPPRR